MEDRRVHAKYEGMDIVRYERAGKWYLEPTDPSLKRQHVNIRAAAAAGVWAITHGGLVNYGLPGGTSFDRLVRGALTVRNALDVSSAFE